MIAFDADVFSDILRGQAEAVARAAQVPASERALPIVVVEEILRGRLNAIRQAEAGKSRTSIDRAYLLFENAVHDLRFVPMLSYSSAAEMQFQTWRRQKLRIGTNDLRISAICVTQSATLVTRNKRDFQQVPGLLLELWDY